MTDRSKAQPEPRRSKKSNDAFWKSGLLALSLATVVTGSALLGRADASQSVALQAAEPSAQRVVVVQQLPSGELLVRRDVSLDSLSNESLVNIPAMPQRPVFRQPITRTRGS